MSPFWLTNGEFSFTPVINIFSIDSCFVIAEDSTIPDRENAQTRKIYHQ